MSIVTEQKDTSPPPPKKKTKREEANEFLRPGTTWENFKDKGTEIFKLAKHFQDKGNFSYARRLYQLLHNGIERNIKVTELLAICTYKDTDLPSDTKYDSAVAIIEKHLNQSGDDIHNANFKGLLGSIYKKKWQYENFDSHLYNSLGYYQEGYEIAEKQLNNSDAKIKNNAISYLGFCGINIVYVFDLLDNLNRKRHEQSKVADSSNHYDNKADDFRKKLISTYKKFEQSFSPDWALPDKKQQSGYSELGKYWFFITLAEAHIGIADFETAKKYYEQSLTYNEHPEWARHTATVQAYNLLELRYKNDEIKMSAGKGAILVLLKEKGIPKNHGEKIGLALSGGGFRASLFHIGVLAQLAEKKILHKVETISCVSGGSIIGAMYYLRLRKLLQEKVDPDTDDYIKLVAKLEKDFTTKIKKNIRLRVLSNLCKNSKMAFSRTFTRTSRIEELYDECFYDNIIEGESNLPMKDIRIFPLILKEGKEVKDDNFNPIRHNWKREFKVPALIINATTLNTGHCWQFTASWMGESPSYINSEFDALPTLRRMYYFEAGKYENFKLSTAVAASAGVPGIFAPVELEDLYEEHEKVLLVDGGVHDNQGITALYEQECNLLIISDASGQMPEEDDPSDKSLMVLLRSNDIIQNRIRDVQFRELVSRKKSGIVRDYILLHFTKDLDGKVVNWKNCDNRFILPEDQKKDINKTTTKYHINSKIQKALAKIRTDLDSFHDSEMLGLMYSGYKMAGMEIEESTLSSLNTKETSQSESSLESDWGFTKIEGVHNVPKRLDHLENVLNHSSSKFGKWFLLMFGKEVTKWIRWMVLGLIAIIIALILFGLSWNSLILAAGIVMGIYFFGWLFGRNLFIAVTLFVLGVVGFIGFNILGCFNRLYIWAGRLPKG